MLPQPLRYLCRRPPGVRTQGGRLLLIGLLAGLFSCCLTAAEDSRSFDIAEGEAARALREVAQQGELDILFSPDVVEDIVTPPLSGQFAPEAALRRLLRDTPLSAVKDAGSGAYAIVRNNGTSSSGHSSTPKEPEMNQPNRKRTGILAVLTAALTLGSQNPVVAQAAEPGNEIETLSPFTVSPDDNEGYRAATSVSGTRLNAPIDEIPISMNVITEEFLEDSFALNYQDALRYTPGVDFNVGFQSFNMRGWATFNEYRDGMTVVHEIPSTAIARYEVVKGPSAIYFGFSDPGGVVNAIRKRPQLIKDPITNISALAGSWNRFRFELDSNHFLYDGETVDVAARLIASYDQQDQWRDLDFTPRSEFYINPALLFQIGDDLQITLFADFAEIQAHGFALNRPNYTVIEKENPRTVQEFLNAERDDDPEDFLGLWFETEELGHDFANRATSPGRDLRHSTYDIQVDWRINEWLFLRHHTGIFDRNIMDRWTGDTFGRAERLANGDFGFTSNMGQFDQFDRQWNTRTELSAKLDIAGTRHNLLAGIDTIGADLDRVAMNKVDENGNFDPSAARNGRFLLSQYPEGIPPFDSRNFGPWFGGESEDDIWAVFLTDQISLMEDRLNLLLGVRHTDFTRDTNNLVRGQVPNNGTPSFETIESDGTVPMVGGIYEITEGLSGFAIYSESLTPNTITNEENRRGFPPQEGKGWEAGVKLNGLFGNRVFGTLTYFDVEKTNIPRSDPTDTVPPIRTLLSGEEAARGIEVDLQLQLTENWQALIGYSYLDTEIVSNDDAPAQEGEPFPGVFDQTLKAWTKYTFTDGILDGLSINGGFTSVPERTSSFFSDPDDPRQTFDGYTRIDAGASYAWETGDTRYKLSLHVQNLTDDIYPETTLRLGPPLTWFVRLDVGL
ncbi:MAG: TonB-dependent siderophore receptor [Opitutales bacterium]